MSQPAWADDPLWYKDAIIYQVHVKAFYDSNGDGMGDFAGLREKLDYVQDLGVNTIWLLPFYPSPLRDDGYDIADYRNVNPDYGSIRDFKEFVREAHRRGLKVITELVINHTSDQHPWFQAARRAPKGSAARRMYVWSDTDKALAGTRIIFTDTETSNWAWDPVAQQYYWHRFFSHQPDLNHNNPAVVKAVSRVMNYWMDMGVDGMRLDAIPYLCVREGTNNENLPETHEVLKQLRAVVDQRYRNRMFLAEANQWPEDVREYFGDGDECHVAYHFPLMPRIYMALALEDRYPITEIMRQTPEIPDNCQWAIFLRNHDELTLEMVTDRERDYMYSMYAKETRMRVNVGIRRRLAPLLDNDPDRIKLMTSLLLSMPGSPILYYGDEIGMGDNIYLGDRNGVRTPMQWSPDRNAGFSRCDPQKLYLPLVMDPIYGFQAVNVEAQSRDPSSLLNWTKRILAIRRQFRAFGRGTLEFVRPGNRKIIAYVRSYDSETILCVANLAHTAQAVELDLARYKGRVPVEMMGRNAFPPIGDLPYLLTLPGHGFFWLSLNESTEVPEWHVERLQASELPVVVLSRGLETFDGEQAEAGDRSVARRAMRVFENEVLPEFLPQRRWFAAKGARLAATRLGARTVWRTPRGEWLLGVVDVDVSEGERQRYLLPLAVGWEGEREDRQLRTTEWALAKARQQARAGFVIDAFGDNDFCLALAEAAGQETTLPLAGGALEFRSTRRYRELCGDALEPVRNLGVEQSNTSVILGERLFLKAYRRLRDGVNPDIEMSRYLTEVVEFDHIAPLAGSLEWTRSDGTPVTLAALFGFVPNQGDGWRYTIDHLERHGASLLRAGPAEEGATHDLYLQQMGTLGLRVGELHAALARPADDPAFAPEPIRERDVTAWGREVRREAEATLRTLRTRMSGLPDPVRERAESLIAARAKLLARIRDLAAKPVDAVKTRFHGDLHLGQLLVVRDDFLIIDFEGEPARPFPERRRKHSVLRDVAGMLRSFDYARAVALEHALGGRPEAADRLPAFFEE
ncbi:MAG TPA: maltose alpha-D-glucosyltransferase, partial [Steroidobacteraceae bacterium]|nr:maltose alpha-D-glucosyltransferase [Steroidobacteraceae bacterium]